MKLRISELDQLIVPDCDLESYEPPNQFIRELVAEAVENGTACQCDSEGCEVTATVWPGETTYAQWLLTQPV